MQKSHLLEHGHFPGVVDARAATDTDSIEAGHSGPVGPGREYQTHGPVE